LPDLIDSQQALDAALPGLRDQPALALDTETDAFFAYRPRICLLQVSVPGADLLIDPLAELDLAPIGELLSDPGREVVLHASENDVILMRHEFGWRIARLFDTQVACFVLGLKPYSLAGILEARFDVSLDKREQRSDWSRRPLTQRQLDYAAADTRHLLELASELHERARKAGREEEIAAECARIAAREWEPEPFDPEAFRRMPGARELDGVGRRILRDLFVFRHEEADRRNRPAFRIAPDAALVRVAKERRTREGPGIPKPFWRRHGSRVAEIVRRGREAGPLPKGPPRTPRGEPPPPEVRERFDRLRRWRTRAAEERGVETFVVARNDLLLALAQSGARNLEELRPLVEPFRFREYGEAILAALLAKP
jgi:ribonuclease D